MGIVKIMTTHRSDFLIVGSGIAGLTSALAAAKHGTVHVITKKRDIDTSTNRAQGGIAAVLDPNDTFEGHVRDTLKAGDGLCKRETVEFVVRNGPEVIDDLLRIGTEFCREPNDTYMLGREGGHSFRRIVHAKDRTGAEVERALIAEVRRQENIELHEYTQAVELIALGAERRCWGCRALNERDGLLDNYVAGATVLATGGLGQIYLHTTNPPISCGDGVSMGYQAGARVANMEFVQFHPTSLYDPGQEPFLISEAVRGEGGVLRNGEGDAFMHRYHEMKDLAPRDSVARAIDNESKTRGESCAYLDVTHLPDGFFAERFPTIYGHCMDRGINPETTHIPVTPSAHYSCGGLVTDLTGQTDLPGLFAIGEVACTGLHGANRLASNSLLEALVFARAAVETMVKRGTHLEAPPKEIGAAERNVPERPLMGMRRVHLAKDIRGTMWDYVGIVRSVERLTWAERRLRLFATEAESFLEAGHLTQELVELRHLASVAHLVVSSALTRRESRGLHWLLDDPEHNDTEFRRDTILQVQP